MRRMRASEINPSEARQELQELQDDQYALVIAALEDHIQGLVLENARKRAGVDTVDQLFMQFDALRELSVSDHDFRQFLLERNIDEAKLSEEERLSVPAIIRMQRVYAARQAYMEGLRRDASVEIHLVRPGLRYKPVEVIANRSAGAGPNVVTVVTDFECPYSQRLSDRVKRWSDTEDVTVVVRHLPLEDIHPYAKRAAVASVCAARAGGFWRYHDWLFAQQDELVGDDEEFELGASEVGLDVELFRKCLQMDLAAVAEVDADVAWSRRVGVSGTPSLFVNGVRARDAADVDSLLTSIRTASRKELRPE